MPESVLEQIDLPIAAENDDEMWLECRGQVILNLLKLDTSVKAGIKNKRKNCGWCENYMMKVLGLINI
ncbi:MAG: hypothetical protein KAG53_06285 [Endozoicomonadaceae bacterium]|nr:hypothetical protein [Endozoicomonadaceae bacterium]